LLERKHPVAFDVAYYSYGSYDVEMDETLTNFFARDVRLGLIAVTFMGTFHSFKDVDSWA
jgi:hypothetical protein